MTPTLSGRIQTRIFLLLLVGVPWTVLITPLLPRGSATLAEAYRTTFTALGFVLVLGAVLWEPLYHLLQQFRWEKDWPILFSLLTVVNEAILVWAVLPADPPRAAFVVQIVSTWVLVWLVAIGPMRVLLIRWRFRGGRVL